MTTPSFGPGCPWYGLYERFGPPNVDWCERTRCAWINEPVNTWSNMAFVLAGLWLWRDSRRAGHPRAALLALGGGVMGALSFLYHASNNLLTQYIDFFGMYVFEVYLVTLAVRRLLKGSDAAWTVGYWALLTVMTALTPTVHHAGIAMQWLIFLLALVVLGAESACRARGAEPRDGRFLAGMAACFALALACSGADLSRVYCSPDGPIQGHALWHVFSAAGMVCAVLHHRLVPHAAR